MRPRRCRSGGARAPGQINDLVRFGTHFDEEDGQLALTREGGHSHRRIVHALGDATGFEVMRALIDRIRKAPNVSLWDRRFTVDLLTHDGRCVGALINRPRRGKISVWAKQTLLAAGGAGMIYRETTNPPVATGDGMAAAYRAGAELRDMEFMQFHPTVLYLAGSSRFLISEAVRGEGAYLRDKDGIRFMFQDLPDEYRKLAAATEEEGRRFLQGDKNARRPPELSPRDVVSRAPSSAAWSARSTPTSTLTCRTSIPSASASASPASPRSAAGSAWTSPATRFRCGRALTTRSAASVSIHGDAPRCRGCGRPAR